MAYYITDNNPSTGCIIPQPLTRSPRLLIRVRGLPQPLARLSQPLTRVQAYYITTTNPTWHIILQPLARLPQPLTRLLLPLTRLQGLPQPLARLLQPLTRVQGVGFHEHHPFPLRRVTRVR